MSQGVVVAEPQNGGSRSRPLRFLRRSTIRGKLTRFLAPLLWACSLRFVLNPMFVAETAGVWACWHGLIDRIEETVSFAPPLVVVSPESLVLRTQTYRDTLRQVFEVVGVDAAGCIRHAGSTEVLRTQTAPVYVFLRPLSVPLCSPELSP